MSTPTARITDCSNHGAIIITGSPDTFSSNLPCARFSDMVACPLPGHGVNPIITGAPSTFTNTLPQARVGDMHACGGVIVTGDTLRYIGSSNGAGVGEIAIGAIYDNETKSTIVFTEYDSPKHEDDLEYEYKTKKDSTLGVTVAPTGTPILSKPAEISAKPDEVPVSTNKETAVPPVSTGGDVDYSMQLSPNFKLSDLTTNVALGKNPLIPQHGLTIDQLITNLKGLAVNCLEPMVALYGRSNMVITSGFRKGSGTSQHQRGMAADIQFKGQYSGQISNSEMVERTKALAGRLPFDQIILEYLGNKPWIHLSYNQGKNRGVTLTALRGKGFVKGVLLA